MFAATTPENMPLAYRVSTSTNPNPVISPAFMEANYETLESLLRNRQSHIRNNDLRTELEYFSGDYDEEREMEPRPGPARAVTPPLQAVSPKIRKRSERVVGFEETQNRGENRVERNSEAHIGRSENGQPLQSSLTSMYGGQALSNNIEGNLHSNGTFLSHNAQPFILVNLIVPNGPPPTTYEFFQWTSYGLPSVNSDGKPLYRGKLRQPPTKRARTIDLHKRIRRLVEHLSTNLLLTFKDLMEKAYTWVEAREKEKAKSTDIPRGEGKKDKSIAPVKAPILMINREDCAKKNTVSESMAYKEGITFSPVTRVSNAPVIIEAVVFRTKVGRVYMDSESTCKNSHAENGDRGLNNLRGHKVLHQKGVGTALSVGEAGEETKKVEGPLPSANKGYPAVMTLKKNRYMTRIPRTIMVDRKPFKIEHKLNEHSHIKPIKQNKQSLGPDRNATACKEAEELTKAGILRKVKHQTWVANPVMVEKNDGDGGRHKSQPFENQSSHRVGTTPSIKSLNEKLAALSRFLSKRAERSLPFFKVLKSCKGKKKIHWTDEADKAIKEIKKFVQALPTLTAPKAGETLIMYLAKSKESINAALFAERSTPIKQALTGPEKTGRVAKWAIDLGEHDIVFLKRDERETAADFLPEIPFDDSEKRVNEKEVSDPSNECKLSTDGASSFDGAGAGLMLIDPAGKEYTYALLFEFETTNNKAEYEALLAGLRIAHEMEITKVAIFLDSQLVVNQIKGNYIAKQLSIKSYLQKEARKIRIQVPQYKLIRGNLYKRSFFTPWLRCIAPPQSDKIIKEIHEGSCEFNAEPRSMVVRITKQGYYWPSMYREAANIIKDCDKCKEQSVISKAGMDGAITVGSTWPFSHLGIHILGPLPMAPGGLQFLAIAIKHSTKWVEAKPINVKNARQVEKFAMEYVVCRFRVPRMISLKEEKHFKEGIFADFCKGLKITQSFSPITEHMEIMHYIKKQEWRDGGVWWLSWWWGEGMAVVVPWLWWRGVGVVDYVLKAKRSTGEANVNFMDV
nr:hypothetical protein [Tanacetum cinerariifolium]